ncbi:MAG: FMN-binding protein [Clostridia bacterium]|nr:FMN-binding protein [Clostridia bacterium]
MPRSYWRLFQAIITLFLICALVGGIVGAVNALTADIIFDIEREKTETAMRTVIPEGQLFNEIGDLSGFGFDGNITGFYEAMGEDGKCIGYCVEASPIGFASNITLLTGLSPDGIVRGVVITNCSGETPGLGNRVSEDSFISQFKGKDSSITFITGGAAGANEVSSITGATYSSRGVYEGVASCIRAVISYTAASSTEVPAK